MREKPIFRIIVGPDFENKIFIWVLIGVTFPKSIFSEPVDTKETNLDKKFTRH